MAKTLLGIRKQFWIAILIIALCCLGWYARSVINNSIESNLSIGDLVDDEFFGAIFVRPKRLKSGILSDDRPIGILFPKSKVFKKICTLPIDELLLLASENVPQKDVLNDEFNGMGAAVLVHYDQEISFKELYSVWTASGTVGTEDKVVPEFQTRQIGDQTCTVVPSGTFLTPRLHYGTINFVDFRGRLSKHAERLNLDPTAKHFLSGTRFTTFSFDDLTDEHFDQGKLSLWMNIRPFGRGGTVETRGGQKKFIRAMGVVVLRNPETGMESEPIQFDIDEKGFVSLKVPAEVSVSQNGQRSRCNVRSELVANGKLEILLRKKAADPFLDISARAVAIKPRRNEFVFHSSRGTIVTQSDAVMKKILANRKFRRMVESGAGKRTKDVELLVRLKTDEQRDICKTMIRLVGGHEISDLIAASSRAIGGYVEQRAGTPKLSLSLDVDREYLERVESGFERFLAPRIEEARDKTASEIEILAQTALDKQSTKNPGKRATKKDYESAAEKAKEAFLPFEESTNLSTSGTRLTWSVQLPSIESKKDLELTKSLLNGVVARTYPYKIGFPTADYHVRRSVECCPENEEIRYLHAMFYAFTAANEVKGIQEYERIKMGLGLLLDGLDINPKSESFLRGLAFLVGFKIGRTENHIELKKMLASDKSLLSRIGKFIDPSEIDTEKPFSNWTIAKLLAQKATNVSPDNRVEDYQTFVRHSSAIGFQRNFAEEMDLAGKIEAGKNGWKECEDLYERLENKLFDNSDIGEFRLGDVKSNEIKLSQAKQKKIENFRKLINMDNWIKRCKIEQTDECREFRRDLFNAHQSITTGNLNQACDTYENAFERYLKLHKSHPSIMAIILFVDLEKDLKQFKSACLGESNKLPKIYSRLIEIYEAEHARSQTSSPPPGVPPIEIKLGR